MNVKQIVIEGPDEDVKITRTERGAKATVSRFNRQEGAHDKTIAEFSPDETPESRLAKAREVAKYVYGRGDRGNANATNSMVNALLDAIERMAGC